jgi:hypothetical protein
MPPGRFPAPWTAERIRRGYTSVHDANGQAMAYVYARQNEAEAAQAKVLTKGRSSMGGGEHRPTAEVVRGEGPSACEPNKCRPGQPPHRAGAERLQ